MLRKSIKLGSKRFHRAQPWQMEKLNDIGSRNVLYFVLKIYLKKIKSDSGIFLQKNMMKSEANLENFGNQLI